MLIGYVNFRRLYSITKIQNVALQRNAYSLAGNRLLANPFLGHTQGQVSKTGEFPTAFQSLKQTPH